MKKWILLVLLYVLGYLFLSGNFDGFKWQWDLTQLISEWSPDVGWFFNKLLTGILLILLIINYFLLRIRANNPVFTFINAMFITMFVVFETITAFVDRREGIVGVLQGFSDSDVWTRMWEYYPAVFILCCVNLIAGIIISEAKSKKAYLTAEFLYLFTGVSLFLYITRFGFW